MVVSGEIVNNLRDSVSVLGTEYAASVPNLTLLLADLAAVCAVSASREGAQSLMRLLAPDDPIARELMPRLVEFQRLPKAE